MTQIDSGASSALSRRIAMMPGPIVRRLPDADVRALSRGGRDATDLTPVMPLRVHEGWYAAYWYGDMPARKPSRALAVLRLLGTGAVSAWRAVAGRVGKADGGMAGGHPAGAR